MIYAYKNSAGWQFELVAGNWCFLPSLQLNSSDNPIITCFMGPTIRTLLYNYYDGASWHSETLNTYTSWLTHSSLELDSSELPHVSYTYEGDLMYAFMDIDNTWHYEAVDTIGNVGLSSSLSIDQNDQPHIAYFLDSNSNLNHAYWDGYNWQIEVVD